MIHKKRTSFISYHAGLLLTAMFSILVFAAHSVAQEPEEPDQPLPPTGSSTNIGAESEETTTQKDTESSDQRITPQVQTLEGQTGPDSFSAKNVLEDEPIRVATGDSIRLLTQNLSRVAITNPEIAEAVVLSESELLLLGVAPGNTSLTTWQADGVHQQRIFVADPALRKIEEILETLEITEVHVQEAENSIILEGSVITELEHQNALKIAKAFRENIIDLITVGDPIQVRIDIQVAEVSRDSGKDIGVDWSDSVTWAGDFFYQRYKTHTREPRVISRDSTLAFGHGLTAGEGTWDEIDNGITAVLRLLVDNGDARMLAQPRLVTLSGKEANFLAGGEIPIVKQGLESFDVEYKEYGVQLTIKPEVDAKRQIEMVLTPEVSSLDFASAVQGVPGLRTRRATTTLSAADGETIIIGGLLSTEQAQQIQKVPLLGSIPILGHLFRSQQFQNRESELLFFVTPHLIQKETGQEWIQDKRIDEMPQTMEEMKKLRDREFLFDPETRTDLWLTEDLSEPEEEIAPLSPIEDAPALYEEIGMQEEPLPQETSGSEVNPTEVENTSEETYNKDDVAQDAENLVEPDPTDPPDPTID